jgi:hypothetical protein
MSVLLGIGFLSLFAQRNEEDRAGRNAIGKPASIPAAKAALPSEDKTWEDALEEALKPGLAPSPHTDEMRFAYWRTGQIIQAKGAARIPDDAGWGILKTDQTGYGGPRQALHVRLHRKVSLDVLRMITRDVLLRASPQYELSFVHFYTPWALGETKRGSRERLDVDKVRWWATSRLELKPKPVLDISIYGLTVEDEVILRAVPFPPGVKVIGGWLCDSSGYRWTIYRDSDDRLYVEYISPGVAKPLHTQELIEIPASVGRRFKGRNADSDKSIGYYLIEEEGDLQVHFKDGIVNKAQAMEAD